MSCVVHWNPSAEEYISQNTGKIGVFYLLSDVTSLLSFPFFLLPSLSPGKEDLMLCSSLRPVFPSVESIMFEKAVLAFSSSCRCPELEETLLTISRIFLSGSDSCGLWKWTTWNPKQFPWQFRVLSFTVSKAKKLFAWCLLSVSSLD